MGRKNLEDTAGFNPQKKRDFYRDNIVGKWVNITNPQGFPNGGYVADFIDNHLILNPHVGTKKYNKNKGNIYGLVNKNKYIDVIPGMSYAETTKKILEEYCRCQNWQTEKEERELKKPNKPQS